MIKNVVIIIVSFDSLVSDVRLKGLLSENVSLIIHIDNSLNDTKYHKSDYLLENRILKFKNSNQGGLAGAYNAALGFIDDLNISCDYLLYLDDDTDTSQLFDFISSTKTNELIVSDRVCCVAPIQVDANTGVTSKFILLDKYNFRFLTAPFTSPPRVSFVINSMSLWRYDITKRLGLYDESLFLDHIDTDFCMRAFKENYVIKINNEVVFEHQIGFRSSYELFGYQLQATGHGPFRRHLIALNSVIMAKRYFSISPAFFVLCIVRVAYEIVGVVIVENNKVTKLKAILKGAFHGFFH